MKVVYISGPYTGKSEYEILTNIRSAEALAIKVLRAGCAVICPHTNGFFHGGVLFPDDPVKDRQGWLDRDFEIIKRCDALMCTENWPLSAGAKEEVDLAKNKLGKPVFTEGAFAEFINWLTAEKAKTQTSV